MPPRFLIFLALLIAAGAIAAALLLPAPSLAQLASVAGGDLPARGVIGGAGILVALLAAWAARRTDRTDRADPYPDNSDAQMGVETATASPTAEERIKPLPVAAMPIPAASEPAPAPAPAAPAPDLSHLTEAITRLEATVAALPTTLAPPKPSPELTKTLKGVQSALRQPHAADPVLIEALRGVQAVVEKSGKRSDPAAAVLARLEAHEKQVGAQLAAIADRLGELISLQTSQSHAPPMMFGPAPIPLELGVMPKAIKRPRIADADSATRVRSALEDIRRAIDASA